MNKGKKGITLLSAVVIIAVLLILMGTVVISTDYMLEETDKKEFIREYNLVKAATKDYIIRNSGLIDFEEISVDISNINSENLSFQSTSQFSFLLSAVFLQSSVKRFSALLCLLLS